MILLGINSVFHDCSAALIQDGRVLAMAEEERFSRIKHAKPARVDNPHELPIASIRYCLDKAGLTARDIDGFCFSFDPERRRQTFRLDPLGAAGDWGHREGENTFLASLAQVPAQLGELLGEEVADRFRWVPHHVAHAASAYYPAGYQDAAVLVIDGIGESTAGLLMRGEGTQLTPLEEIEFPHSLGFLWEKLSKYLGFSEYDACKVMGLASYGDSQGVNGEFSKLAQLTPEGFAIDPRIAAFRAADFTALNDLLGPERQRTDPITADHYAIAAALQDYTDDAVLTMAKTARRLAPSENLCYAGGVALNCVANWRLKEESGFENVFIPSAPNDSGTAAGAALSFYYDTDRDAVPSTIQLDPYLGPAYSNRDVEETLAQSGLEYRRDEDVAAEAARRVAQGEVVGWFQGGMEFGPRA
ncbi:MAG: carbamoyltransferase N-terminal domain-containing protein, partial [Acidobacteriota bacterium]